MLADQFRRVRCRRRPRSATPPRCLSCHSPGSRHPALLRHHSRRRRSAASSRSRSIPRRPPSSSRGASGPWATGRSPSRASPVTLTSITSAPHPAVCGRPPTPGSTGHRSSTVRTSPPSAHSPSRHRMPTSSGPAPVSRSFEVISPSATASTSPPMRGGRGRAWDSRQLVGSDAWRSIQRIRTSSSSPRRDIVTDRSRSAGSFERQTAARPGSVCCSWTRTRAVSTS